MKRTIFVLFISAFIFTSCQQTATKKAADPNQEFDVVILNGRVMDPETNFDGVRNVGVKDSEVLKVFPGKPIRFPVEEKGRLDQIEIEPRVFDPNQS